MCGEVWSYGWRGAGRRKESGVSGKQVWETVLEKGSWSTGLLVTENPREMRQKVATGFGYMEAAQVFCKRGFGGVTGRESQVAVARGHLQSTSAYV